MVAKAEAAFPPQTSDLVLEGLLEGCSAEVLEPFFEFFEKLVFYDYALDPHIFDLWAKRVPQTLGAGHKLRHPSVVDEPSSVEVSNCTGEFYLALFSF